MLLNRTEALLLSKILFHYEKSFRYDPASSNELGGLFELADKLEEFLTDEKPASANVDKAGDIETEADDIPDPQEKVSSVSLHDLSPIDAASGSFEFEEVESGEVDALLNGEIVCECVTLIKRSGKTLELWSEDGDGCLLELKKLTKLWKATLKDGLVYEVS